MSDTNPGEGLPVPEAETTPQAETASPLPSSPDANFQPTNYVSPAPESRRSFLGKLLGFVGLGTLGAGAAVAGKEAAQQSADQSQQLSQQPASQMEMTNAQASTNPMESPASPTATPITPQTPVK